MGSASVPVALDAAARSGQVLDGDLVLLAGFGGGMAVGAAVLRWHTGAGHLRLDQPAPRRRFSHGRTKPSCVGRLGPRASALGSGSSPAGTATITPCS